MIIPFEDVPSLRMLLGAVTTEPLIDILLAAGLTRARLCVSPWQTVDCGERRFDSGPGDQG